MSLDVDVKGAILVIVKRRNASLTNFLKCCIYWKDGLCSWDYDFGKFSSL